MIIVVEGSDGSGKTTLARRLANDLHGVYLKTEVRPPTRLQTLKLSAILRVLEHEYTPYVISDRHHAISDRIYAPAVRHSSPDFDGDDAAFAMDGMYIIFCDPGIDTVRHNVLHSDQMKGVAESVDQIYRDYVSLFTTLSHRSYDYASHDYERLLAQIRNRRPLDATR